MSELCKLCAWERRKTGRRSMMRSLEASTLSGPPRKPQTANTNLTCPCARSTDHPGVPDAPGNRVLPNPTPSSPSSCPPRARTGIAPTQSALSLKSCLPRAQTRLNKRRLSADTRRRSPTWTDAAPARPCAPPSRGFDRLWSRSWAGSRGGRCHCWAGDVGFL